MGLTNTPTNPDEYPVEFVYRDVLSRDQLLEPARRETLPANISGPAAMLSQPSGSNWSKSARTSASRMWRMEQTGAAKLNPPPIGGRSPETSPALA
jgi:hypothetical protein